MKTMIFLSAFLIVFGILRDYASYKDVLYGMAVGIALAYWLMRWRFRNG